MWENVAEQINVLGPPIRSGSEWKKVWQDQKCRVKKKIGDNNKSLHGTGGGPCNVSNLNQMVQQIDRICHLSSAAAPSGTILGVYSATKTVKMTPPRKITKIAAVTPTTSKEKCHSDNMFSPHIATMELVHPYPSERLIEPTFSQLSSQKIMTSTPESTKKSKKRKNTDSNSERLQLVQQQTDIQRKTLQIMEKHAEAAKTQAETSKVQSEATKLCLN